MKAKTRARKMGKKTTIPRLLRQFKASVESQLGRVDWKKWGKASLVLLIFAAATGLLGPKPAFLARSLLKMAAVA